MEYFLYHQLYWRADYCLIFALMLAIGEWLNKGVPVISSRLTTRIRVSWPATVAVLLSALFVYHNYAIHRFVQNVAARDFFLTADGEGAIRWLKELDRRHDRYELATASIELNYLSAYWTNADLLLPSGFPFS
jgi:hypothetical protein